MVAVNLGNNRSRRCGKGRGDQERAYKGGGGESGISAIGKKGIWRRDLDGGGGGVRSCGGEYCGNATNGLS